MIFGDDTKFFNGEIAGQAEFAEIDIEQFGRFLGATYTSAGNASGTMTLSATQTPKAFMIDAKSVTDGNTGNVRLLKCFSNQFTLNFDRENFTIPNFSFVAVANKNGNIAEIED